MVTGVVDGRQLSGQTACKRPLLRSVFFPSKAFSVFDQAIHSLRCPRGVGHESSRATLVEFA